MTATADDVIADLEKLANPKDAIGLAVFFRSGPGDYGEGDRFLGIRVPETRKVARRYLDLRAKDLQKLLDSEWHEHRLTALHILAYAFAEADANAQQSMHYLYIRNVKRGRVNNWDLVDTSAGPLVGAYLVDRPRDLLFTMARSPELWSRRVAIVATMEFLKAKDASTTLELATLLRHDSHDLMHKAVGWLLREVGKRVDPDLLRTFLHSYAHELPRTMLRYAIEHFSPDERRRFLLTRGERGAKI